MGIIVILAKEAELNGDITHGESSILGEVEVIAYFNANILRGLINCFLNSSIVDGSSAESAAETSDMGAREKMLTYTVKRVCSLLATKNEKRLDPMQVDLLEGMKSVALRAKCIGSGTNMSSLADLCSGFGGSMAVEQLKSSLIQL